MVFRTKLRDVMDENSKIEVFVFPDGTSVEMFVFDGRTSGRGSTAPAATAPRAVSARVPRKVPAASCHPSPPPPETGPAHECPVCGSTLVYPLDWDRSGPATWTLWLRCPECETRREVVAGRAVVERFNRELYDGAQALAREADQLTRRNFEDEAARMIAALEYDLIQPMDF